MRMFVKTAIVGALICFTNVRIEAQQFELNWDAKIKTLDYNSDWYIVQNMGSEDECCNSRRLLGEIIDMTQDTMYIKAAQLETRRTDGDKSYNSTVKFNTKKEFPIYAIVKSDIKNIQKKENGFQEAMVISGGILFVTSLATAINALLVDGDDRRALFISSGIQLGAAISFSIIGSSMKKKYIIHENAWHF